MRNLASFSVLAVVALLGLAGTGHAATAAAGNLGLTFGGCPADVVPVAGVNGPSGWTLVVGDANPNGLNCLSVDANSFSLDPTVGGCAAGQTGGSLCLGGATVSGSTVSYSSVTLCFADNLFAFCLTGTGSLTLA
ncbi:MAG: hypothetical protein LC624_02530 [Halobacteriales archaeon]|nr:hypothetical protein [Halobacteriales archaeon]